MYFKKLKVIAHVTCNNADMTLYLQVVHILYIFTWQKNNKMLFLLSGHLHRHSERPERDRNFREPVQTDTTVHGLRDCDGQP